MDNITLELLKAREGGKRQRGIRNLLHSIWISRTLPEEWYTGVIIHLHKKGDQNNYLGITLLNSSSSIKGYFHMQKERSESTSVVLWGEDLPLIKSSLWAPCFKERRNIIYHLFIDCSSAYDIVIRERLLQAMEEMKGPKREEWRGWLVTVKTQTES